MVTLSEILEVFFILFFFFRSLFRSFRILWYNCTNNHVVGSSSRSYRPGLFSAVEHKEGYTETQLYENSLVGPDRSELASVYSTNILENGMNKQQ